MTVSAAFAIPGDIETLTGGYIYERKLLLGLRALGHDVAHLALAGTFPDPSQADMDDALAQMAALPATQPLIVDGLVFGAAKGLEAIRAPMIAMIHHPLALEEGLSAARKAHLARTERANVSLATHILVPSAHTREILIADYGAEPGRITIAPPGVDRPSARHAPSAPPLILSVGILHPRKGHDVLLDALASLTDLSWRAVIVGSDYDTGHATALRQRCAALSLEDRVSFAGELPRAELDTLFAEATLFALATRYEGYGMVFAEALVRGLPIVATRAGAVPDTVPDGAGLLAPIGDALAFAACMRRVLEQADLRRALARGSAESGAALPAWEETARIASGVIARVSRQMPPIDGGATM
ncbi:MAG: glycosyltransferase family 4 protein [Pseudomonadota bacterium]